MKLMLARLHSPSLSTVAYRVAYAALTLVVTICMVLLASGRANAVPVVDGEFDVSGLPQRIAQGPDGNMWVTVASASGIEVAKITPDGTVTPVDNDSLDGAIGITAGPGDNMLWVTQSTKVTRFDPANPTAPGTTFPADIAAPQTIVVGPDGNLWTASADKVLRITPTGTVTPFTVLTAARGIAASGDLLWVVDFGAAELVSVTTDGTTTRYPIGGNPQEVAGGLGGQVVATNPAPPQRVVRLVPGGSPLPTEVAPGTDPFGIAFGADQAYWFAQAFGNDLGRLTADGQYTRLGGFSADAGPRYVAPGPGNTLWVALQGINGQANNFTKVARISGLEPPAPAQLISAIAPAISKLRLSPKRFRVGKAGTPVAAQKRRRGKPVPVGTKIRFTLADAATVRMSFERKVRGKRVGKRCVSKKLRARSHKPCRRWTRWARAIVRENRPAGAQAIPFSGRSGRKALKPGSYRLTAVATDSRGNQSKPTRVSFNVVQART
jgi:virginiamycin B lyase